MARIIIAAKDGPVRRAIHGMLASEGHKIRSVEHGGLAYQAMGDEKAELVICDAKMPVVDGVALMLMGRMADKDTRFLLMSADPYLGETLSLIDVAVDGVLAKPFSSDDLRREVKRLLPIRSEAA